jgi:hypothetical protein
MGREIESRLGKCRAVVLLIVNKHEASVSHCHNFIVNISTLLTGNVIIFAPILLTSFPFHFFFKSEKCPAGDFCRT